MTETAELRNQWFDELQLVLKKANSLRDYLRNASISKAQGAQATSPVNVKKLKNML